MVWELKAALEGLDDAMPVIIWREGRMDENDDIFEPLEAMDCFYRVHATGKRGFVLLAVDDRFGEMADRAHDLEERVDDLEAEIEALKKEQEAAK